MPKTIKEFQLNQSTGEVSVEYSDDSTSKFNAADMVTAQTDPITGVIKSTTGSLPIGINAPFPGESWYQNSLLHHATNAYICVGYDAVDKVVFIRDDSNGVLRIATSSDGWNTLSISNSKGLPADIPSTVSGGLSKVLRFNNKIYMMGKNGSNLVGVYRADPVSGNTTYSWSSALVQMGASATAIYTCFSASSTRMYLGEYGDPAGGPTIWSTTDGINWTQIYTEKGQGTPQRHVHAVAEDPYNSGHIWVTMGDANAPREIIRSRDYGSTWEIVTISSAFQGVQISFSQDYAYVAGDSARGSIIMIRKSDNSIRWGGHGKPSLIAVPAAAALGDAFYTNAYFGIIDEATGEFWSYATDTSAGGNIPGLFVTPTTGAPIMLAEKLAYTGGGIDIFDGWLWFGRYRRKLHAR